MIWQPAPDYSKPEKEFVICPPYVPPEIDTFYEQPKGETSPTLVFVENRQDRPFTFFETFYSEPPMANQEEYPTPHGMYDAKTFEQELLHFVEAEEASRSHEQSPGPPPPLEEPVHFHGQIDQSHHAQREAEWKQREEEIKRREEEERQRESEIKRKEDLNTKLKTKQKTDSNQHCGASGGSECDDCKAAGSGCVSESDGSGAASAQGVGIQGGVAKIETFSPEELQDPNRRYQWEQGQIDYTGIDSFDNIQKRLQEMMSSKEKAESLGPVSGEPPKPQVPLTPSGKPLKPAIKQPPKMMPKSVLKK